MKTTAQNSGERLIDIFKRVLTGDSDSDNLPDAFETQFTEDLGLLSGRDNTDAAPNTQFSRIIQQ